MRVHVSAFGRELDIHVVATFRKPIDGVAEILKYANRGVIPLPEEAPWRTPQWPL